MTGPVGDNRSERRRRRVWEARVDHRLGRLERAMWIMTGAGLATSGTAIWNLITNLSQGAGPQ